MSDKKVLVVDDEPSIRNTTALLLRTKGWTATQASNGQEALEKLTQEVFDLVVTDVIMPGATGVEVYKYARANGLQMPFVFMSGYTFDTERAVREIVENNHARFLQKPFRIVDLYAIAEELQPR